MQKKDNPFLKYLDSKYADLFAKKIASFLLHNKDIVQDKLDDMYHLSELTVEDNNAITVYIDSKDDDTIEFDIVFNPDLDCYCRYGKHHDYESVAVNDIWVSIPGRATLSSDLKDMTFGRCEEYNKSKPKKPLEGHLIPVIYKIEYENYAQEIFDKFYSEEIKSDEYAVDIELIAKRMGANLKFHEISKDKMTFGQVFFEETIHPIYSTSDDEFHKYKVPANTIIIDRDATSIFSLGSEKITIAHELVHFYFHKKAFHFAKLLNKNFNLLECKSGGLVQSDDDPMKWFEIHANGIAPYIMLPKNKLIRRFKELEDFWTRECNSYLDAIEHIIIELAQDFKVTQQAVKKRLIDLGFDAARGAFDYVDGNKVPTYGVKRGTLKPNETYSISIKDLMKSLNGLAADMMHVYFGKYTYVEYHLCINDKKYIQKDIFGKDELTPYARTHMEECCVKFECKAKNSILGSSTYGTFCYLCNVFSDNLQYEVKWSSGQTCNGDDTTQATYQGYLKTMNEVRDYIRGKNWQQIITYLLDKFEMDANDLAIDSGVALRSINRYISGEIKKPDKKTFIAICMTLQLPALVVNDIMVRVGITFIPDDPEDDMYVFILKAMRGKDITEINYFLKSEGFNPLNNAI